MTKIDDLIAAGEKATQGEWHKVGLPWNNSSPYIIAGHHDPHVGKAIIDVIEQDGYSGDDDEDIEQQIAQDEYEMQTNCDFIALAANAREDIKAMRDEVKRLREALKFYADDENYGGEYRGPFSQRAQQALGDKRDE